MSRLWKVYMVKCAKGALYTGIVLDVLKRLAQHNAGTGAKSIRALGRPVRLMYSEIIGSKRDALKREYEIKQMTRAEKIKLIKNQYVWKKSEFVWR